MKYNFLSILSTLAIIVLAISASFATSTTVTSTADSDSGSLRAALIDSTTADTVFFDPSLATITLTSQITIPRDVVIIGNGINETVLSGGNDTRLLASNFKIYISSMTIRDGSHTGQGGALFNGGKMTIENVLFTNNKAATDGGAIITTGVDTMTLINVTLDNNRSLSSTNGRGGAIFIRNAATLIMEGCRVTNNSAVFSAGAISSAVPGDEAKLFMDRCVVSGNHSTNGGGGMVIFGDTVSISNSLITGNQADSGAGLYFGGTTYVGIHNSTVASNNAVPAGDIIDNNTRGGGIFIFQSNVKLHMINTIVGNNTVTDQSDIQLNRNGPDVFTEGTLDFIDLGGNLISDSTDIHSINPFISTLIGTYDNPIDPEFVIDIATDVEPTTLGDYRLRCSSPAIDAGKDTLGLTMGVDVSGLPRLVNGMIDIGAHEQVDNKSTWIVNTTKDNIPGSLRSAVNNTCIGDTIAFSNSIDGHQIELEGAHLILDNNIVVIGNGIDETIISGMENSRIFEVSDNHTSTIRSMTLEHGKPGGTLNGGAIYNGGGLTGQFLNIRFNEASIGGGIYSTTQGSLNLSNSQIVANYARIHGGGIYSSSESLILINNTIAGNTTSRNNIGGDGGGMFLNYGTCEMRNTIVAKNSSFDEGPDIFTRSNSIIDDNGYNLIGDSTDIGASVVLSSTTQVGDNANPIDPLFMSDPFANDGQAGNVRLQCGSPAIDAGDPNTTTGDVGMYDVDGLPRVEHDTIDIGAHERPFIENWIVTTTSNSGPGSLREGISNQCYVDSISFDQSLDSNPIMLETEIVIDKDIIIIGNGQDNTILDGSNNTRIFYIEDATTTSISEMTIQNGEASDHGGGIYNDGSLDLDQVTLKQCVTQLGYDGAGIYNRGTIDMINSKLINNDSEYSNQRVSSGGAVHNQDGILTLTYSEIKENKAQIGAGIYNGDEGSTTIANCNISSNTTTYTNNGGGIYNDGILTIKDFSIISNNYGGGIYNSEILNMDHSTISNNYGSGTGGGLLHINSSDTSTITNSIVSGNRSVLGGGIWCSGSLSIVNSTISGNIAAQSFGQGGGIHREDGTVSLRNCIVAKNFSVLGEDISGIIVDNGYNLIGDSTTLVNYNLNPHTLAGNAANPLDPRFVLDAAPVDNNGNGGNAGDLRLWCTSPAIDAGTPDTMGLNIGNTDVLGLARIVDDRVDIGAHEYFSGQLPNLLTLDRTPETRSFEAAKNIKASAGFNSSSSIFRVEESVELQSSFEVSSGQTFEVIVDTCPN